MTTAMQQHLDLASRVEAAARDSELLAAVGGVRSDGGTSFALGHCSLRPLSADEVAQLERQGNTAEDWSLVRVAEGFVPSCVRQCNFVGHVALGRFDQPVSIANGLQLPSGVYNSTLGNCLVGHGVLVRDVRLLANYVVGPGAVLLNVGSVLCDGPTPFGNGVELPVAIETGGREVAVFAELDVELAAAVARSLGQGDRQQLERYNQAVADYAGRARSQLGIIGTGALLRDTAQVHNSFIGPYARLDGAARLADSTLLSNRAEPAEVSAGACVTGSILQWGCHVTTMAIVDSSVLTEHSHVERHGKVTASILGPNTGVAEGEATSCLLGPFVGFHHQALLIAVLWPEGKGNVGYGANVGSNHTSKAPDQEFWPGEGAFLGLGVNIKYPADFSRAPYSIIASGVSTLPQRIAFPFSLVNTPSTSLPGVSPAYNEIIPAWLLTDNMYTLKRNEGKYQARNKARRTRFDFSVFRPETVELMRDACRRLESVSEVKEFYLEGDIQGLGKNYMLERYRRPAIEAYKFYMAYYALLGLKDELETLAAAGRLAEAAELLETPADRQPWEHQRRLLREELEFTDVAAALRHLPEYLGRVARDVEQSKAKDDVRGGRIIDDYGRVHTPASQDKFVRQTWEQTRQQAAEVQSLLERLGSQ